MGLPSTAVLLACGMMEAEVGLALEKTGAALPVVWMERGLHSEPERLREALQAEIDRRQDASHILLAYGQCGTGTVGLSGGEATLVAPRFDDCLRILMAKGPEGLQEALGSLYYLTSGWIDSPEFLLAQCERYRQAYGEKNADYIIDTMFANYTGMRLIDTGAYDLDAYRPRAQAAARRLKLALETCSGGTRVLEKLLAGDWDGTFCVVPPHEALTAEHFLR